jgi:hypothetical protein
MQQMVRVALERGLFKITEYLYAIIKCEKYSWTICCTYTVLPAYEGQLASPKHAEV